MADWPDTAESREQLRHLQRLATVGGMTAQVAHELNNTLMALQNWAQQGLKSVRDSEAASKALMRVCANAERATEICRGLLGLSGGEAGDKQMVPVNDIIKEAADDLQGQLDRRRIALRCSCPDDLAVYGKRVELLQVLLNIMINGSQAMAERGGTLGISAEQDPRSHCVSITVSDTGPGIKPHNIRRIFEPFFSTKLSADSPQARGSGLGLAICKDIVTSHGGFIEVDSVQGQGASFTIFLPGSPSHK